MNIAVPFLNIKTIWEFLATYTLQMFNEPDNNTTYVTICDLTAAGILVSIWHSVDSAAGIFVTVKITRDGVATEQQISGLGTEHDMATTMLAGFATSLKVEMKLSAAQTAEFGAVVLTE